MLALHTMWVPRVFPCHKGVKQDLVSTSRRNRGCVVISSCPPHDLTLKGAQRVLASLRTHRGFFCGSPDWSYATSLPHGLSRYFVHAQGRDD
eukprot:9489611-Pyramimonas_sp.AAC.2